ncbi:MAG: bifunctional nuclease family protein [SAR324 cluster bacterium]|nr:bifunctional nuclease family protein [SAR324 cluster bacterium]MCZ6531428.1 bifunctional nuclease family protein [SAR324 cluster bacterium]MCZ6557884.1 bifunctional nuclease family protein [SAR324 cluster bacterium]MCZ6627216.1 bifunctional nuclease family protein [SAR324 cluster bacterium]MCZ6646762.1 bifunctional nuclease family protein [SAR324 cluster bacterium]
MEANELTEMKVYRLVFDPQTNSPIVILQDEGSGALMPIWIGIFEAHSIAMKMEGVETSRPLTHDLLSNTFSTINGMVERIEVVDLVDNTYFARIYFQVSNKSYSLDSRPSDAIALALRTASPIFVANHVLERSKIDPSEIGDMDGEEGASEEDQWTRVLKNYNPEGSKEKLN